MKKKKVILIILLILIIVLIVIGIIVLNNSVEETIQSDSVTSSNQGDGSNSTLDSTIQVPEVEGDAVTLNDRFFLSQLDDIYLNYEDYEGKTIQYEGFIYNIPDTDNIVVCRNYYCCGYDASLVGLECIYDESEFENDTWVTVTGTIVISDKYTYLTPLVEVTSIVETEEGERIVGYY